MIFGKYFLYKVPARWSYVEFICILEYAFFAIAEEDNFIKIKLWKYYMNSEPGGIRVHEVWQF